MTPYSFYKLPFEEQLKNANMSILNEFDFYKHSMENRQRLLVAANPLWEELENKLLLVGGDGVGYNAEPHLDILVSRGVPFKGKSTLQKLENSRCHSNIAFMWSSLKDEGFQIVTGWALTKSDNRWRQHTWGLTNDKITETTVKRSKYFGVILTDDEAKQFYAENSY